MDIFVGSIPLVYKPLQSNKKTLKTFHTGYTPKTHFYCSTGKNILTKVKTFWPRSHHGCDNAQMFDQITTKWNYQKGCSQLLKLCPVNKNHFSFSCWQFIQCQIFFGWECTWLLLAVCCWEVSQTRLKMSKWRTGPHCIDLCVCPTLSVWALLPGSAGSRGLGPRRAPPECDYRLPRWCSFPVAPSIHSLKPCCPGAPSAPSLMLSEGT